ncbi:ribonuclease R [Rhodovibrionaceae bacterium A322]
MATKAPFPTKDQVLEFIRDSATPVSKREIAQAFHIKGEDRRKLKALLQELKYDGDLDRSGRRKLAVPGALAPVAVLEIIGPDEDGELLARPAKWDEDRDLPKIYMVQGPGSRSVLAAGDRVLAKLQKQEGHVYNGSVIRKLGRGNKKVLGIYEQTSAGGRLRPVDKRAKHDYSLKKADSDGAEPGELVLCEVKSQGGRHRDAHQARVVERLGSLDNQSALSLIAIHEHGLPTEFRDKALAEAEAAEAVPLGRREDLRHLPLITIDGADARDFDDAVFAEADPDEDNPGGWHLLVAIADVAHYVHPGSALDKDAAERGNSAYFPDRVVPMLPEALSNGWCSLRPKEERGCLAVEMWIDAEGNLLRHRFLRGLMRSAARTTYEQVQDARDGHTDDLTAPLLEPVIQPLYGAFQALLKAREARGTLELDVKERQIHMNEEGQVTAIEPRQRLDSHRLIEEFMITANVAAAIELEKRRQPCMYRVHEEPDKARVESLREVLASMGQKLAKGQVMRPKVFTGILERVADTPQSEMVSQLVLRCQSQALYSPENLGHFGLALPRYAHFTSPIRRYSDLLVHRALIRGLNLGKDGLSQEEEDRFKELGEHISMTERRAATAERDAKDRLCAAFMSQHIGEIFTARINGVTRFGLFLTLDDSGADGLVPISSLPEDFYDHDEKTHSLVGRRWGREFRLGEKVAARLLEADPLTGGMVLALINDDEDESDYSSTKPTEGNGLSAWNRAKGNRRRGGPGGKKGFRKSSAGKVKKGRSRRR